MTAQRLNFVCLTVSDIDRSIHFYRDVLGLALHDSSHDAEQNDPWFGGPHAATSWTDGAFLHFALYPKLEPQRPVTTASQLGFSVSDIDAVHRNVLASNVTVLHEPRIEPWGKTARYLDPDDNIVSITQA